MIKLKEILTSSNHLNKSGIGQFDGYDHLEFEWVPDVNYRGTEHSTKFIGRSNRRFRFYFSDDNKYGMVYWITPNPSEEDIEKVTAFFQRIGIKVEHRDYKLNLLTETRIINPEEALKVGDITLYHGTNWDTAIKAKKGQLGPQPLKQYVVNILVNHFGEAPDVAAKYYDKNSDYRKHDPKVLYLSPSFRTARNYAVSNTEWGGEVITDVLYKYASQKYARSGDAQTAIKWIQDHRTKDPAVVTVTVPLTMVFTHPHWVTPARKRLVSIWRNIKRMQNRSDWPKQYSTQEIVDDLSDIEVFVYESIPSKYVQRIDRV